MDLRFLSLDVDECPLDEQLLLEGKQCFFSRFLFVVTLQTFVTWSFQEN
jgi:hypothetical protein